MYRHSLFFGVKIRIVPFISLILLYTNSEVIYAQDKLYLGADLSYVNEIEDCGGYYSEGGVKTDPFLIFSKRGANLVRVRLWHTPSWTNYSTFTDVCKTIRRSKEAGMNVLLDIHYSDDWADPQKQIIPAAWAHITDKSILEDSIYNYTFNIVHNLDMAGLLPEMIQIGNETNNEILMHEAYKEGVTINWLRNISLFNKAIAAVKDACASSVFQPKIVIHIAQPENALVWFEQSFGHHISDFDIIGLSYYSKWSKYSITQLSEAVSSLKSKFGKEIMIVETAYPWCLKNIDQADNILGQDALVDDYPATPEGQMKYMIDLTQAVVNGGGSGIIYWEPAWISSSCKTRWGSGSHWENASFFDPEKGNDTLPVFRFFSQIYSVNVK